MLVMFDHEQHKCDYFFFFYNYLVFSNQVHDLFLASHRDCHKTHRVLYYSDEVAILSAVIFLRSNRPILKETPCVAFEVMCELALIYSLNKKICSCY